VKDAIGSSSRGATKCSGMTDCFRQAAHAFTITSPNCENSAQNRAMSFPK
jgi:hypothetical protein